MLQSVHVKNLALIDEIEVDFSNGLNILTGETGAGKSIILGSVNLALGGKFNKEIIRKGSDYGLVEICFYVDQPEIIEQLKLLEIYPEDGVVVLSRRMTEGRSVSRITKDKIQYFSWDKYISACPFFYFKKGEEHHAGIQSRQKPGLHRPVEQYFQRPYTVR